MFIAYIIVSVVLALLLTVSAGGKLTRKEQIVTALTAAGVRQKWFPYLAALMLAGAVGLLVGIAFAPLGIAAAAGVILYFVGALVAHLRVKDFALLPALVFLALAVAALLLRVASM